MLIVFPPTLPTGQRGIAGLESNALQISGPDPDSIPGISGRKILSWKMV